MPNRCWQARPEVEMRQASKCGQAAHERRINASCRDQSGISATPAWETQREPTCASASRAISNGTNKVLAER
ncbi:hypothetical protein NDU88_006898 [Pleurodeles waltl]|uniref:Uncharacterized protein n=1 Tax=Pleurodeles waltl TaxID=8319 RepID=A0AAV7NRH9_PLEWA|nr:hypothetical protein NDU88_006898 [Pleurodeles waltl]